MFKELTETTVDLELGATCESRHTKGPTCSVKVEWSRPPFPCGCVSRSLVCHSAYTYAMGSPSGFGTCLYCGHRFPMIAWQKGWYKV